MTDTPLYEGRDLEVLADLPNYYAWILDQFGPYLRGSGIEFGAGSGTVSARLRPHLDRLELVEPSANLIDALQRRFAGDAAVTVVGDSLEARLAELPDECVDCTILVNVLEHIEDDAAALTGLYRILKPGGHLLLFVPAMQFLYSRLDASFGHFRRYHRKPLVDRVMAAGFCIETATYFDLLGILPWGLVHTLGRRTQLNPRMARLYDRIGVPLTRAIERRMPPPLGKNVLVVGEKPAVLIPQ